MRTVVAVLAIVALPVAAMAQSRAGTTSRAAPLPPIGLPLPQIGLPLPPIGLPAATGMRPSATPRPSPPHRDGSSRHHDGRGRNNRTVIWFVPAYGWGYPFGAPGAATPGMPAATAAAPEPAAAPSPAAVTAGTLRLEAPLDPATQLFVDGYFTGTIADTSGELTLPAGTHRVEIRSPGAEPVALDVMIVAGRSITYRGVVAPPAASPAAAATPPTPAAPTTIYLIPGCYLGNIHPSKVDLPAECKGRAFTTLSP